ncbi:hypothetical protein [Vibrio vulnificus]|uniref:hypothetical protein n=1 Tax=Vibrio vulnificus TaxID=672 RepID=UPI001CCB895F|nr:hypothetical protein [Vibrio vulnificus]MCA0770648.1 hypothetical protein [Vibrio vulnificus]MCA3978762.1 hypothetical protein [Vibrio vulnificus]MCA4004924.1 hypothetical protein [Vibrio vulnificus]HDY8144728.1 hypothetical protein [Vibrio vulnificus]
MNAKSTKSTKTSTSTTESNEENTRKVTIGVAMPMSPMGECGKEHWEEVFKIIQTSFDDKYEVAIVSKSNEMTVIQDAIVNNLYRNDIVICDVSCGNPNVMFELGMRLAFDKPTLIIKDFDTPYSFDTAPIRHIEYPRSLHYQSIVDFKKNLKRNVDLILAQTTKPDYRTFLSNFGNLTAATVKDKEVSESEYIIKTLDSIMHKFSAMENNQISSTLSNKSNIDDTEALMNQYLDEYCAAMNVRLLFHEHANDYKDNARDYVLNHITAVRGTSRRAYYYSLFDRVFDDYVNPF